MPGPTNLEQYLLELVNDARLNPQGDAARYLSGYSPLRSPDPDIQSSLSFFGVNGAALQAAFSALAPAMPLAWSETLAAAARTHNGAMIASDQQTHQAPGEAGLGTRITDAGYVNWSSLGENVFAFADNALQAHAGFMVDWGQGPNGMQSPPGHRDSIMNPAFREIGIAITAEANPATEVGPLVVTEDFGVRFGTRSLITGVAYRDADRNGFYTPGEGRGDLRFLFSDGSVATTWESGGYTIEAPNSGTNSFSMTGGGLSGRLDVRAILFNQNVKLDVIDGDLIRTSMSGDFYGPFREIQALNSTGQSINVSSANPVTVRGGPGRDGLSGGFETDTFIGGAGNDLIMMGFGDVSVYSGPASAYSYVYVPGGPTYIVTDNRPGSPDGTDQIQGGGLRFSDRDVPLGAPSNPAMVTAVANILRMGVTHGAVYISDVSAQLAAGQATPAQAIGQLVARADSTTSVATLAYQFFTDRIPTAAGYDYLVSPSGGNGANLNSTYYQAFNLENRYINFAVNLGKLGEGRTAFQAQYGNLSLTEATKAAYAEIFGGTPTDAKVAALLAGGRDQYFAYYGQDGTGGIGTKAAMVGWLLAEAEKADSGMFARANAAFLADLADGAAYNVDLIGVYGRPEYVVSG